MRIPGLRGLKLSVVARRTVAEFLQDKMSIYAAALSYYLLLAIFPFTIFLIALLSFLNISTVFDWLLDQARRLLPQQALESVAGVIGELRQQQRGLLSLGVIGALWSASSGVRGLMDALNVAYNVDERRPAWKRYPLSIIYTLGLAALIIVAAGLMLVGPRAIVWLADQVGLGQVFTTLWRWLRLPIAALFMMCSVAIVYYALPNVHQRFRFITPGAALAVLVWVTGSLGFGYYVSHLANYQATYGSLGAIIILLLHFYLSANAMLLGAELNAVIMQSAPAPGDAQPQR
jgi:membrane protein